MKEYIEETERTFKGYSNEVNGIRLDDLVQSERIRIIINELVKGKPRYKIIAEYAQKWETQPKTIKCIMNEAIVHLHNIYAGNSIEEMRSEQVAKLEELYNEATISEKLKIIDLQSSTLGLYNTNVTVKTEDEIKINLGV